MRRELTKMKMYSIMMGLSGAAVMTVGLAGSALADNVVESDTGAGSTQSAVVDSMSWDSSRNTNIVTVVTTNGQSAQSGDVSANGNTSVGGGIASGDAGNVSGVTTGVGVANGGGGQGEGEPTGGTTVSTGGGTPTPTSPGGGSVAGVGTTSASQPVNSGRGGSVLGAATTASATVQTLPVTGPSVPVDVSALRAAYHASGAATPTAAIVQHTGAISNFMLVVAAVLAVASGLGSAWYTRRKEGGV